MKTFETQLKKARTRSFGYLFCALFMVESFIYIVSKGPVMYNDYLFLALLITIVCFILEIMHFYCAYYYFPKKYGKMKEKTQVIDWGNSADWSSLRGIIAMLIFPIPIILSSCAKQGGGDWFWLIGISILTITLHLILRSTTQSSRYVLEKQITIDLKYFLPQYYISSKNITVMYCVPIDGDNIEYRNIAIKAAVQKEEEIKKSKEETDQKIKDTSKSISEEIFGKN